MTASPTAPAAMPSEEEIARAIYMDRNGYGGPRCKEWSALPASHKEPYQADARAVLALFAPILAEKERARQMWQKQATTFAEVGESWQARALAAEAALAAERERCAQIAYRVCAETRHITLGDKAASAIRAEGE